MTKASNTPYGSDFAQPSPVTGDWWHGGVIYQIYPRSYADANGDGIGDLRGVTQRLEHIAKLGADGIWLSPFFKSPMKDFGYDVSDYCDVDPLFGNLSDFRELVDKAHALGLRVMIDQVISHTSDQHAWFKESRSSRTNDKADWYVWADPKADGNPPNNWLSIFGGSAWHWDTKREQYYMHNFLTSQPDLNFHNPKVQQAVLDSVRFWLEFGVDGFRLDTANFYFHDEQLRDNPPRGRPSGEDPAVSSVNPYAWQHHVYDKSRPENLAFLKRLRVLLNGYPNTTMVGEIGDDDGLARLAEYTADGDKLHMAYCFDLFGTGRSAPYLRGVLKRFTDIVDTGWPCWAITNHDVPRVATRWGGANPSLALLKASAAFLLTLRGSVCVYQGDELGLPEAEVAFEDLQDPYGITMWPEFKGRDGCRTPMAWEGDATDMGFGSGETKPWLPLTEAYRALAVDKQSGDADSLLNFYTQFITWRRQQPLLRQGALQLLGEHPQVVAFVRELNGERMVCAFNMSNTACEWAAPSDQLALQTDCGVTGARASGATVAFEPFGALIAKLP